MKHVLFVAYYFPPIAASGGMRPLGFCRHLAQYGWRATILTTTPESVYPAHPVDHQLEAHIPTDVQVEHVGYRDSLSGLIGVRDLIRNALSRRPAARHDAQEPAQSYGSMPAGTEKTRSILKDTVLDWLFAFPDRQASWIAPAVARIMALKERVRPDVVVATGGPWSNFLVGRTLARRFGCPLMLDYRDPWTCNPYYSFSTGLLTAKARRLEKSICVTAARVITNTEELRDRLCTEYPEIEQKCFAIPNGFDPGIMGTGTDDGLQSPGVDSASKVYELCHFGTVYGKRTPGALFQAVWDLYQEGALHPEHLRLRFVGAWESTDETCNHLAQQLEKHGLLRREGPMSHQSCVRHMKQASVLLVVQPESPLQVPGKIYEYIAVGRPLLLVGGEGATAGLVQRHNLGLTCPNELKGLKSMLHRLVAGSISLTPPDRHTVERFSYHRLAKNLADSLEVVIASDHGNRVPKP
jgi:hypothetical protein